MAKAKLPQMYAKQIIRLPTTFMVGVGCFGKIRKDSKDHWEDCEFYGCREDFHRRSSRLGYMVFCHPHVVPSQHIASFINKIETMVGTQTLSVFAPTNRNNIVWIKVSPWWSAKAMRRSLFTVLLRAAQRYNPDQDNFEEALWSNRYLADTQPAVRRFLDGHTWYTGRTCGWLSEFRYPDKPLEKLLVKPPKAQSV